jgi:hypothetical protein
VNAGLLTEKAREAPPFRAGEESAGSANGGTGLHFDSVCGSIVFSPEQDWASVKKPIAVRSRKGVLRKRNLELQAPAFQAWGLDNINRYVNRKGEYGK